MASRTYDIELDCGCMLSADGGGGLISCGGGMGYCPEDYTLTTVDIEAERRHIQAWEKFKLNGLDDYELECERRNH